MMELVGKCGKNDFFKFLLKLLSVMYAGKK